MPGERSSEKGPDVPRTDLSPTREPYTDDFFGTGEEEGVVREREDDGEGEEGAEEAARRAAEEAAGGDREIL